MSLLLPHHDAAAEAISKAHRCALAVRGAYRLTLRLAIMPAVAVVLMILTSKGTPVTVISRWLNGGAAAIVYGLLILPCLAAVIRMGICQEQLRKATTAIPATADPGNSDKHSAETLGPLIDIVVLLALTGYDPGIAADRLSCVLGQLPSGSKPILSDDQKTELQALAEGKPIGWMRGYSKYSGRVKLGELTDRMGEDAQRVLAGIMK